MDVRRRDKKLSNKQHAAMMRAGKLTTKEIHYKPIEDL
jgi:hypothetical protein